MTPLHVESGSGYVAVELTGDLDIATIAPIREQLLTIAGTIRGALILDLARVTFIDSGGLGMFVLLHKRVSEGGGVFALVNVDRTVGRPLGLTSLDTVFPVHYRRRGDDAASPVEDVVPSLLAKD